MSSDDADVAREARRARDLERAVVDVIRKDGTFDALRRRVTEEVSQQLRAFVADAVTRSRTLRSRDADDVGEKELVDRLREEMEEEVMTAYAKQVWDALTDESKGVGREMYEAVYEVRERLEAKAAAAAVKEEGVKQQHR